jgi:iron complex outermembrane receptor protein
VTGSSPDLFVDPTVILQRDRSFTPASAAIGFLQNLPWGLVASVTAQHVQRAPRGPELLSRGVHEATGTFDIGDPNLTLEKANTVEAGLRRAQGPLRFEATAYYTRFNGFIFRRLTGETCEGGDFTTCTPAGAGGELNQAVYTQRDATFRGGEIQAQFDVAPLGPGLFGIDGQYDIVRATFTDGTNVPRIPPQRVGGGLYWRSPEWFVRLGLLHAAAQNNIAEVGETPTVGYNLLKAEIVHTRTLRSDPFGISQVTVGVVGNNLLDDDVRNHVSFKKDEVLLPGRNFKFFANFKY